MIICNINLFEGLYKKTFSGNRPLNPRQLAEDLLIYNTLKIFLREEESFLKCKVQTTYKKGKSHILI